MKLINQLINHPLYIEARKAIDQWEAGRIFCGHDTQHFLDVARIGYIYVLEEGIDVSKEVVYAYAFLHDIGRAQEYAGAEQHDKASARIAKIILEDLGVKASDQALIVSGIEHHRDNSVEGVLSFEGLMYKADKASRACYQCKAQDQCYWDEHKKNLTIEV